jgi:AcrR family transcriptional regulator
MTERRPLGRELILETALRIADTEGLDALGVRRVARELSVTPMALYRYVQSKDDLLDGIGDYVLGRLELGESPGQDWKEELRRAARSYRRLLVDHPAAAALSVQRRLSTPNAWRVAERLLELLRGAGFDAEEAARLYQQIARFLLGLAVLEVEAAAQRRAVAADGELAAKVRSDLEKLSAAAFPRIHEGLPFMTSPPDFERNFELGLELLLAGLEELLRRKGRSLDDGAT